MAEINLPVSSPIKGVNRVVPREGQPPDTCWDAFNVMPFDTFGRNRVAQRFGTSKLYSTQLSTAPVQGMLSVNTVVYPSGGSGGGGGSTHYVEPFVDIGTFNDKWFNTPLSWTISGSALHIPSTWNPPSSTTPLIFRPAVVLPGNVQIKITFTVTGANQTALDNSVINIWAGMNPSSPPAEDPFAGFSGMEVAWNWGGVGDSGTHQFTNVGPLAYSSTTSDFVFSNTSTFPYSQTFTCIGNFNAGFISDIENGISTTLNNTGPNTGQISTNGLPGSKFFFLWVDGAAGVNIDITDLEIIYPGSGSGFPQSIFQSLLVAVCDGFVFCGQPPPVGTIAEAGNQPTAPLASITTVSMAAVNYTSVFPDPNAIDSGVYIVDGLTSDLKVLNVSTLAMQTFVPKSSTALPPTFCSLAAAWRGRLVLAGDPANPQNFYMSRVGDPADWDYGSTDGAQAVAGNLSVSGHIGEPITALIPYTDDYMIIGCANSLWMMEGDLAAGGSIVLISNQMGIVGKDAWCVDPMGTLYFIASGGLYSVKPIWEKYQPPTLLTEKNYNQFFQSIPWSYTIVSMVWDADLHYLNMFFTPISFDPGLHLIFDARNGGLWPTGFPSNQGPYSSILYLSDNTPGNRAVLLGGNDGYIRKFDSHALDDDGVAIAARVTLGPFKPAQEAALLTACTIDLGEISSTVPSSTFATTMRMSAGPDAFSVTEGLPHTSTQVGSLLDRRQKTFRQRLRGGWFSLQLANGVPSTYFSFETALLEFNPAGRNRERR